MWQNKTFPFLTVEGMAEARQAADTWLAKVQASHEVHEVYTNNAYGYTYRPLRKA